MVILDHSAFVDSIRPPSESRDDEGPNSGLKVRGMAWGVSQFRKLRAFPFSVFFIVGNEFCERFSYYGMSAVLILFLRDQLSFSENRSTAIFHTFSMLCYFFSILGAIISDSCLGKYWTILSLSVVYCLGNIAMSVSAIPFENASTINLALAIIGLTLITFGTGGIKPCVSAFGGEQFKDGQNDLLNRFFSIFYFSINAGSLLSMILTPILRSYVNCFDTCQCFSLAFGVPAVLMIIAVPGTRFYVVKKPNKETSGLYLKVLASIATAIYRRIKLGKIEGKKNLLQYACPRYTERFMDDVRLLLRVFVMLLPLPVFSALYNQQGSRWTLQATRMNGKLGSYTLPPDQMQAINGVLILLFIPLFEAIVYPLFGKCRLLKRSLQRMVAGMFLAGCAFILAGVVELKVEAGDTTLKAGETKLVMFNALPASSPTLFRIESINVNMSISLQSCESKVLDNSDSLIPGNYSLYVGDERESLYPFQMVDRSITQMVLAADTNGTIAFITDIHEDIQPDGGDSSVQVFNAFGGSTGLEIALTTGSGERTSCFKEGFEANGLSFMDVSNRSSVSPGSYRYIIYARNDSISHISDTSDDDQQPVEKGELNLDFNSGAVFMIVVSESQGNASSLVDEGEQYKVTGVEIDEPNSVSIFLQVPMYVIITAAEVMFAITGLEFAYSQAPVSMRAMCQAMLLLTIGGGDLIVIIVAESSFFESRTMEFFFFAGLIFVVTIIFAIMSFFYKYVDLSDRDDDPLSRDSVYNSKSHDDCSALLASSSREQKPLQ